jgi:ariadne-1
MCLKSIFCSCRYQQLLLKSYVDDFPSLKWCPFPNCEDAIYCKVIPDDLDVVVPSVSCSHDHRFCFGCSGPDHQPANCRVAKMWLKKCADDSETSNWIAANTKECPKCQSTIEKNGGCNHMTCRKCKYEVLFSNGSFAGFVKEIGRTMALHGIIVVDMKKKIV